MGKKLMILILILIIVLIGFLIFNKNISEKNQPSENHSINRNNNPANNTNVSDTPNLGSGLPEGKNSGFEENSNSGVPSDLYTQECGYYFASYSVCAGTCPEGRCVSESRSCYCKK